VDLPELDADLDPAEVVAAIAPLLLPERAARLDAAARGRLLGLTVVMEEMLDPHNYGAVLRSCESMGLGRVYAINEHNRFRVSPRVTQGCERWLDIERFADPERCLAAARAAGYRVLAAVPGAALTLDAIDPAARHALCFGNEHLGLSPRLRALADGEFAIPMFGLSQSLNVSVAVAVSIAAVASARRRALGTSGDLSEPEVLRLRARFYAADVRGHRAIVARAAADRRLRT